MGGGSVLFPGEAGCDGLGNGGLLEGAVEGLMVWTTLLDEVAGSYWFGEVCLEGGRWRRIGREMLGGSHRGIRIGELVSV